MTVLLPTLCVALAALYVWLTVRIVNRRERWAKWTLAALVVVAVYPLSMGPAYWVCTDARRRIRADWTGAVFCAAYDPLIRIYQKGPPTPLNHYLSLWGAP
jgi:hypothetical protein